MLYPLLVAMVGMVVGGWSSVAPYHEDFPKERLVPVVQSKILRHMNRTTPPSDVAPPLPFLPSYVTRHFEERKDSEEQRTIVIPENKIFGCVHSNRRDCSRFQFEVTPSPEGFSSVQVWFRKRHPSNRLLVSVFINEDDETRRQDYDELRSTVTAEDRWVGFTLLESALEDLGDKLRCVVEVSGGRVFRTGPDGPFLLARTSAPSASRARRSAGPGCDCRVVDRVLTLNDLSWDKWIIAPQDLNIRACRGYCRPDQSSFNITYGSLMHNLVKSNPGMAPAGVDEFWLPRCVPAKMTDMKMIYVRNGTTDIVETNVKNLVIEECTCMANNCHRN